MSKDNKKINFATGIYLPKKILTNEELEKRRIILSSGKQLRAERILEKIGVERRHIASANESVADMAYKAAKKTFTSISANKSDKSPTLDLILVSSSYPTPYNIASEIKKKFKIKKTEIIDFHAACSASAMMFSYIYKYQNQLLNKKALLIAAEKFGNNVVDLTHPEATKLDPSLGQTIFGDGAAAINFVIGKDIVIHYASNKPLPDPDGKKDLIVMAMGKNKFVEPCMIRPVAASPIHKDYPRGYFTQNGPKVFSTVQKYIPSYIYEAVKKAGFTPKDIDLVVTHPGSKRLVDALKEKLKKDFEVYSEYEDANMSSVSLIYSFIKAIQNGKIGRGSKIVLCGFGAGSPDLYSSTVVIELK
jgi:3-oxoacyl-[acyl-carrier-protein] synthase III